MTVLTLSNPVEVKISKAEIRNFILEAKSARLFISLWVETELVRAGSTKVKSSFLIIDHLGQAN